MFLAFSLYTELRFRDWVPSLSDGQSGDALLFAPNHQGSHMAKNKILSRTGSQTFAGMSIHFAQPARKLDPSRNRKAHLPAMRCSLDASDCLTEWLQLPEKTSFHIGYRGRFRLASASLPHLEEQTRTSGRVQALVSGRRYTV